MKCWQVICWIKKGYCFSYDLFVVSGVTRWIFEFIIFGSEPKKGKTVSWQCSCRWWYLWAFPKLSIYSEFVFVFYINYLLFFGYNSSDRLKFSDSFYCHCCHLSSTIYPYNWMCFFKKLVVSQLRFGTSFYLVALLLLFCLSCGLVLVVSV